MNAFVDDAERAEHRRTNLVQSMTLVSALALHAGTCGFILMGVTGAVAALALAVLIGLLAPRIPAELMMRLYRAQRVPEDNSQLVSIVELIASRAGLARKPDLYVIPSMTLNAFSSGDTVRPAIALSEGLLRRLTLREIAGVVAHEMSHIRANDLGVFNIADAVTRTLQVFAYAGLALALLNLASLVWGGETFPWSAVVLLYLGPALSSLLQLSLDRTREYHADLDAVELTGDPMGLASALKRVETYTGQFWEDLMLPVPARRVPQPSLLRIHPKAEDRISRLLALGRQSYREPIIIIEKPMVSLVGLGPIELKPRYRWPGLWY